MTLRLKPLAQQVIVLTGATSGIGLVTARKAADHGARLVLAARNGGALAELAREIEDCGGAVETVVADVGVEDDVTRIADAAIERFGSFDTWINNAGVSIYGMIEDSPLEDQRRLFETNYWGVVHGCLAALPVLRLRGGALVNVGSLLGDRAIPVQGVYSASKFAVRGFTEALRMELEAQGSPVSVTLVKPAAIATPYRDHAVNYTDGSPRNPPPVYAPEAVAEAILHAAHVPVRDITVGGGGKAIALLGALFPRMMDTIMERTMFRLQQDGRSMHAPSRMEPYHTGDDLHERSPYPFVREHSWYTRAGIHPYATMAVVAGLGVAATLALRRRPNGRGMRTGRRRREAYMSGSGI